MRGQERMFGLLGGQIGSHRDPTMADEKERSMTKTIENKRAGPPEGNPPARRTRHLNLVWRSPAAGRRQLQLPLASRKGNGGTRRRREKPVECSMPNR